MLEMDTGQLRSIDQELKEAVCNALVNLTVERVTGGGEQGEILYGISPRRSIVSGQLLPRFDQTGQSDESSDIRIAAIGMDFQVASGRNAELTVTPQFSIYVRVLPDWRELQDENLGLDIEFKLRRQIQQNINARTQQIRTDRFTAAGVNNPAWTTLTPEQKQAVRIRRNEISREATVEAYREQGILLQQEDTGLVEAENPAEILSEQPQDGPPAANDSDGTARLRMGRLLQRNRVIPFGLLDSANPPSKWRRIDLTLPIFTWQQEVDEATLQDQIREYAQRMRQVALQQVTDWLASPQGAHEAWRNIPVQPVDGQTEQDWLNYRTRAALTPVPIAQLLPKLDQLTIQIDRLVDYIDPSRTSIRVTLDNRTAELGGRESIHRSETVFCTQLSVRLPTSLHQPLRLDRVEPSYRFRHFLTYHAIGLNCGIINQVHGEALTLQTTWSPRFVQPRIMPRDITGLPVAFSQLADEATSIGDLLRLPRDYEAWVAQEEERLRDAVREGLEREEADIESRRLTTDLQGQRLEAQYIERGIRLLEESQQAYRALTAERHPERRKELERRATAYRAWLYTNQSFLRREKGNPTRGWRLFQLAFVLAHIPTFASRMQEYSNYHDAAIDEEQASLLYFPTGGGKSEAFYGTLVYAMFLDRLRGKERGVTAMVRYPLRLLTLQQGQRLLKLIVQAEILRRELNLGTWPFEIGFWVGSTNTPNRYTSVQPSVVPRVEDAAHPDDTRLEASDPSFNEEERKNAASYCEFKLAYNKVPECPVCRSATGLRRFEAGGPTAKRLGIVCFDTTCEYNRSHNEPTPLPFLLTDDTIYARAPSIVLGTIDKMAMLGHSPSTIRQVMGMFGMARGMGPTGHLYSPTATTNILADMSNGGYQPVFPAFRAGQRVFFDPFPSLIIQDEAHLLEESLGTFSGLFDTLFESILRQINQIAGSDLSVACTGSDGITPRMPKIIAATATISNPERQLEVLYQRGALRFPYPGPDIYRSFFAGPANAPAINAERIALENELPLHVSPELTAPWMRLFVSVMTNDATHTVTAVTVLSAFHTIITKIWRGLLDPQQRMQTIEVLRSMQGSDITGSWRQLAIERAISEQRENEIMALIDLHRIALTYVTNKKGGDQVMDALDTAVLQRHRAEHEPLDGFISRLISGGIDIKEIQEIMEQAERAAPGQPYTEVVEKIRNIVATSAISHGVDVDRFNSMFFAGLPSDIAEYIQASSRVGRTHVGFVILVPTPQSRRDRYVVETHDIFHRFLERMISPPAVERWAENAIRRVLASVTQSWGILKENALFVAATDDRKSQVESYDLTSTFTALTQRGLINFADDLGGFVLQSIGFFGRGTSHNGAPVYDDLYRSLIDGEVMKFGTRIRENLTPTVLREFWKDSRTPFRPPMTSLRDVDEAGIITAGAYDGMRQSRINLDQVGEIMRAIRSQRGTVAETDSEQDGEAA
ncbi:MAG: DEAD/DEAH box helicase [Alphaproteobacteria bacterium]|nr:DEAD/DEAH box helicase [Alphaproteobacteria bacterium]